MVSSIEDNLFDFTSCSTREMNSFDFSNLGVYLESYDSWISFQMCPWQKVHNEP